MAPEMSISYQRRVVFLSWAITLTACGGGGVAAPPPPPTALNPDGHWVGSTPNGVGGLVTLEFTLAETNRVVTGSGTIETSNAFGPLDMYPVIVSGTFASPTIALEMRSTPGSNPSIVGAVTFSGTMTATTTTAKISGLYSGVAAMTLVRTTFN